MEKLDEAKNNGFDIALLNMIPLLKFLLINL